MIWKHKLFRLEREGIEWHAGLGYSTLWSEILWRLFRIGPVWFYYDLYSTSGIIWRDEAGGLAPLDTMEWLEGKVWAAERKART